MFQAMVPQADRDYAAIQANLAVNMWDEGQRDTAVALTRRALGKDPFAINAQVNLGVYLGWLGEIDQADAIATGILKNYPDNADAWGLKATLELIKGNPELCVECSKRAFELAPGYPQAKFNLACAYLRTGNLEAGWPLFEARKDVEPAIYTPPPVPEWKGEKVDHLFVYCEQGLGDRVQFSRFLPLAAERAKKITFAVDRASLPLFGGYSTICEIMVPGRAPIGTVDAQVALMSLPLALGINRLEDIPHDPGLFPIHSTRGALIEGGLKIGVAWKGNPKHYNDICRSMPFKEIMRLASDPRQTIYGFQVGPGAADIVNAHAQGLVHDLSSLVDGNLGSTPTLIANLDLIVTVDTGLAHIAAAMGKPVFLMISRFNDWRWLWDREDSPWYPSVRIFRQDTLHDWRGVIKKVQAALNDIHLERLKQQPSASTELTSVEVESV